MRRIVLGGLVGLMAFVLTGCPTPTPPGYSPPKVVAVDATPQVTQPGETVTLSIEATTPLSITGASLRWLITPSGSRMSPYEACDISTTPLGSFRHVLITATCEVPTFASNGTWRLEYYLSDSQPPTAMYPGLTARAAFEVTGGNEDRRPPQLISHSTEPSVIGQETTFTLHMRLRDDSPLNVGGYLKPAYFAFVKPFSPQSAFLCSGPSYTPVTATDVDVAMTCRPELYYVPGRAEPGLHRTAPLVADALGHEGNLQELWIDVQPGA